MKTIWTIMRKELARVFKDPKLIISVLILPGLLLYGLYSIMGNIMSETEEPLEPFVITYHESVSADLEESLTHIFLNESEVIAAESTSDLETIAKGKVSDGTYQVYVYEALFNGQKQLIILYNDDINQSNQLAMIIDAQIKQLISVGQEVYLYNHPQSVIERDIADQAKAIVANMLPFLIMTFLFQGAMSVGPESIAGDKERGTISALLATPTKRSHIAIGKIFSLSILSTMSAISSFIGVILSMQVLVQVEGAVNYLVTEYICVLAIIVSTVILITSLISVLSATAKNIKEASMVSMPLMIVSMVIGVLTMGATSGTDQTILYFIPLYNSAQCLVSIFNQQISIVPFIITIGINFVYALIFGFVLTKQFNSEKVMFSK